MNHKNLIHEIYILKGILWYHREEYHRETISILLELLALMELQASIAIRKKHFLAKKFRVDGCNNIA